MFNAGEDEKGEKSCKGGEEKDVSGKSRRKLDRHRHHCGWGYDVAKINRV